MENTKQMNCQCDCSNSKSKSRIRSLIDLLVVVALVLLIVKMLFMSEWWHGDRKHEMMWRWESSCGCMMDANSWEKPCGMMWMMKNMMWDYDRKDGEYKDKKIDSDDMTWSAMTGSMTGMTWK